MQIDIRDRGEGKTTNLILDSYFTGIPIVTTTQQRKAFIEEQARFMGFSNIRVYIVNEIVKNKELVGAKYREVYIGELQDVLEEILSCRVVKATMTRRP